MSTATPEACVQTTDLRRRFEALRGGARKADVSYRDRVDALRKLEQALLRRKDEIVQTISADFNGRAAEETLALDLFPTLNEIRYAVKNLKDWMTPRSAPLGWQFWPARARVQYQPLGVVGVLAAWNYPLFLGLAPVIGAIAAGNHVMLKPSELAPRSADLLASLIGELYPPEFVTVVTGDGKVAAEFSALPFDHLLFTGSTRVGKMVMRAASENLTPVTLELGGKSPALIHPDFSISRAAEAILAGKLFNAGQTCVAPDYVLVSENRLSEFLDTSRRVIARMYPRLVDNPDYTRIINESHYRRLRELTDGALARGAQGIEVNPASEACNETNRVFPPTLLSHVPDDTDVMHEEIFGPVLPIVTYSRLSHAIDYINARPHPLALYYFDDNSGRVQYLLDHTRAGGVTVNDCMFHVGQPCLPFGGVGSSGMGQYHGFDGFATFSKKKPIFLQSRFTTLGLMRPPYGATARRLLKFIIGR